MDYIEEQQLEFEALHSIYMEDFHDLATKPASCMIDLSEDSLRFRIKFMLPHNYPEEKLGIDIPMRTDASKAKWKHVLIQHLDTLLLRNVNEMLPFGVSFLSPHQLLAMRNHASLNVGEAVIFTLVEAAKEWIIDNKSLVENPDVVSLSDSEEVPASDTINTEDASPTEGKWDYVIGLVGKPSAGKSTFFNAATKHHSAKVAAHPFTTIEPNHGQAYYSIPDVASRWKVVSDPAYGRPNDAERYVPLLLKDVAGLVPGASDGKGRGNRFLNNLCDADVLIHVVDASGKTNEMGEEVDLHDPAEDVRWLTTEIHNWIYNNIKAKWEAILKRPSKLPSMFTGYHASPHLIDSAFRHARVSTRSLGEALPSWDDNVLHRVVDSFITVRFPILLALNKSDADSAPGNIERLTSEFPSMTCVAVSSRSECVLQEMLARGVIECAGDDVTVVGDVSAGDHVTLDAVQRDVMDRYGGTNVLKALNEAVSLRKPTYAYPVHDLSTLRSHDRGRKGERSSVLRDCLSLKPGTTVNGLYQLMIHHHRIITGSFVRAEALDENFKTRILRKDDVIDEHNCVIKIMTTKKS